MDAKIYVTAPFPEQLEYQARVEAAQQGISRAELVRRAVSDYLKRLSDQQKQVPHAIQNHNG